MTDDATLAQMAATDNLDQLEEAWLEALEARGPADPYLEALHVLVGGGRLDQATTLVTLLAESLLAEERYDDAYRCLRPVAHDVLGKEVAGIRDLVVRSLQGRHQDDDWFPLFLEKSGISGTGPLREAMDVFERLLPFRPGSPLLHFREGQAARMESLDPSGGACRVRFADGSERRFSVDVAQELLAPLDPDDWRARYMDDPEGVIARAMTDPAEIIRGVAKAREGKVSAPHLKADLLDRVVPKSRWNSWWKKAREAATEDPLISVEGAKTRPVFVLRDRPLTLDEEAHRTVRWAGGLADATAEARRYRTENVTDETRKALAEEVARRLDRETPALAAREPGVALEAALMIEEWGCPSADLADRLLRSALTVKGNEPGAGLSLLLETIPSAPGRKAALDRLAKVAPEEWPGRLARTLGDLSRGALEDGTDRLLRAGHGDLLFRRFREFLENPFRHRHAILHLTRTWAQGALQGEIPPAELMDSLLPLARDLARPSRGEKPSPQLLRRLTTLLVGGKSPLIVRLLDGSTPEDLERWVAFLRVTPDVPWEIAEAIRARAPEGAEEEATTGFWQQGAIYCSEEGIARRREELRILLQEKIPANQKAIGEAADHGDLSENAEWQSAIEEQGNLAELAKIMEEEIARAVSIESQERPEGIVCPGSRVIYRDNATEVEHTVLILGPWDEGEEVVSYRAPVGEGLLGRKVGDRASLKLPGGDVEVTILRIEPAL